MARTGHKSQAGLDRYKRPGLTKNVARVSQILTLDNPRDNRERMLIIALVLIVILVTFILTSMLNWTAELLKMFDLIPVLAGKNDCFYVNRLIPAGKLFLISKFARISLILIRKIFWIVTFV